MIVIFVSMTFLLSIFSTFLLLTALALRKRHATKDRRAGFAIIPMSHRITMMGLIVESSGAKSRMRCCCSEARSGPFLSTTNAVFVHPHRNVTKSSPYRYDFSERRNLLFEGRYEAECAGGLKHVNMPAQSALDAPCFKRHSSKFTHRRILMWTIGSLLLVLVYLAASVHHDSTTTRHWD